jgi:hypothetical protein
MVFFIFFCALSLPVQVAFEQNPQVDEGGWSSCWAILLFAQDIFFIADVPFNFFLAFMKDSELKQSYDTIAVKYLTSWCVVDVVVGVSGILGWFTTVNSGIKFLRVLKLLHLAQVGICGACFSTLKRTIHLAPPALPSGVQFRHYR